MIANEYLRGRMLSTSPCIDWISGFQLFFTTVYYVLVMFSKSGDGQTIPILGHVNVVDVRELISREGRDRIRFENDFETDVLYDGKP